LKTSSLSKTEPSKSTPAKPPEITEPAPKQIPAAEPGVSFVSSLGISGLKKKTHAKRAKTKVESPSLPERKFLPEQIEQEFKREYAANDLDNEIKCEGVKLPKGASR